MAHTYSHLPPSLVAILKEVVNNVDDAISGEIGLNVKFKHNGFKAIVEELIEESQVEETKNVRYPLIALIQPFTAKSSSKTTALKVRFDLLICVQTDKDKTASERESESYDSVLRPVYAELKSQLKRHPRITFSGITVDDDSMDIYHLGGIKGGKEGYELPDIVDAIIVQGMEFYIEPENPCAVIPCVQKHDILLFDCICGVEVDISDRLKLKVTVTNTEFINNTGESEPISYTIDWGNGTQQTIEVGVVANLEVESLSVGYYIATITSNYGATHQFEYSVRMTDIKGFDTLVCIYQEGYSYGALDCQYYFNYPLGIVYYGMAINTLIASTSIALENGNSVFDGAGVDTADIIESFDTFISQLLNSYSIIVNTANSNQLENKTILNLKNI
jgi:hypothetical protein